jgi:Fe-S-cluster containining protein
MMWIIKLPLRIVNALMAWWWWWMEVAANWLVGLFVKTEYVRKGKCNRCGKCCRLLALEMPARVAKRPWLIKLVSLFHDVVLNFELAGQDRRWLIYRCRYFIDGEEPRCRIYRFRHRLCRFYPTQRLYGHPKLHAECGFSFVRRDGKPSFDEVLRSLK